MVKMYGIPNCISVKKAMLWMKENKVDFEFHDFKTEGISLSKLKEWSSSVAGAKLLNKQSTTFRQMDPDQSALLEKRASSLKVIKEHPTLIKRPVIEYNEEILIGYNEDEYNATFLKRNKK